MAGHPDGHYLAFLKPYRDVMNVWVKGIVGPSNLITLLESIPPYWAAVRVIFHERMGDPTTPEGRAQLEAQSPLNFANRITAPLLVIHDASDPRVKQRESDQIVIAATPSSTCWRRTRAKAYATR